MNTLVMLLWVQASCMHTGPELTLNNKTKHFRQPNYSHHKRAKCMILPSDLLPMFFWYGQHVVSSTDEKEQGC